METVLNSKPRLWDFYEAARNKSQKVNWGEKIWRKSIQPRRSLAVWKAFHGKLATENTLQRKGFSLLSSGFVIRLKSILIISSFTATSPRQYGLSSRGIFQVILDKNDGMKGLFSFAFKKKMSKQVYNLWISGVVSAIWLVWKLRNLVIF